MPPNQTIRIKLPHDKLPAVTPESISAQLARSIRRIEELEFSLQRIVNWLDNGLPDLAKQTAMEALRRKNPSNEH